MSFAIFRSTLSNSARNLGRATLPTNGSSVILQRRLLSDQTRATIDTAVKAHPLVLFMKGTPDAPQCGFSRAVMQILDLQGVPPAKMQTYNVLADADLRTAIKEYSDWPTIPQLYVKGEFIGGCDIVMSMHQSGELEQLLEKSKVIEPAAAKDPAPST